MDIKEVKKEEIIALAEKTKHYCDLLIIQSENWLSEEEGVKNVIKRLSKPQRSKRKLTGNKGIKVLICILLSLSFSPAGLCRTSEISGQEADYVAQIEKGDLTDEETAELYEKLIMSSTSLWNDPEKAKLYALKALEWAEKKDSELWIATFLYQYGAVCWDIRQTDSAMIYIDKSLEIIEGKDAKLESKINLTKGASYQYDGQYEPAIYHYMKILELTDRIDDNEFKIRYTTSCYTNIGSIYFNLGNTLKAEEYLLKGKNLIKEYKQYDLRNIATVIYNILAEVYSALEQKENARDAIQEAYEISKSSNNKTEMVHNLTLMSDIYLLKFKDAGLALKYAEEALAIANESNSVYCISQAEESLMFFYLNTGNEKEALKYAESVLAKTEPMNWISLRSIYYALVGIYAGLGDLDKVNESLDKYREYIETISEENLHTAIQEMEVKYDVQQKELEIVSQQTEIDKHKTRQYIYIGGLVVAMILLVLLLYIARLRTKRNRMLAETNATKDKFFSIISHDLKNPAIAQRDALQLLTEHADGWDADSLSQYYSELLKSADGQVELLYNLLNWAQVQTGRMPYTPTQFDLAAALQSDIVLAKNMAERKGIAFNIELPDTAVVTGDSNMITTVVRNLLTNAVKFTGKEGCITLAIKPEENERYTISVSDTGTGMSEQQLHNLFRIDCQRSRTGTAGEQGSGLGLVVCKELIEKHGSTLHVESTEGKGSIFSFTI